MIKRKEVIIFSGLLITHLIHILEEALGDAYFIDSIYKGLTNFLIINLILWIIPLILLFYVIKNKKIAYLLGMLYGLMMAVDGLDHIIRRYRGYYSGGVLIILGLLLFYYLWKESKGLKGGESMTEKLNFQEVKCHCMKNGTRLILKR